jgi:polyisoprenoid-binding protein YceI
MTSHTQRRLTATLASVIFAAAAGAARANDNDGPVVEIRGGTATFEVSTNVPALNVHGKSTALAGRARIQQTADGLVIEQLNAAIPVRTLNTGMSLRDDHMRKRVFETAGGELPDLRFSAERVVCSGSGDLKTCQLSGTLMIRDTSRPFTMKLKVDDQGGSFKAAGDGIVKLSAYGIPAPSQLGVTTADDVKLHVDFVVKPVDHTASTTR